MNAMRPRNSVFNQVGGLHPRYSVFDLSYVKTMTADMGILYPVMCDEVVPGDIFKIGNQMVLRFQPMLAPILHEINAYVHYFFVPYRLLWDSWEDFITGGPQGNLTPSLPTWVGDDQTATVGTLWDYFGFQTIPASSGLHTTPTAAPLVFPKRAYNLVWNEYYRDETLQAEVSLDSNALQFRNWEKDYFTSSLPWQQRGQAPALPISGTLNAVWASDKNIDFVNSAAGTTFSLMGRTETFGPSTVHSIDSASQTYNVLKKDLFTRKILIIILLTLLLLLRLMSLIFVWRFRFKSFLSVMLAPVPVIRSSSGLILVCLLVMNVSSVLNISEALKPLLLFRKCSRLVLLMLRLLKAIWPDMVFL